jgi:hypothetical protein
MGGVKGRKAKMLSFVLNELYFKAFIVQFIILAVYLVAKFLMYSIFNNEVQKSYNSAVFMTKAASMKIQSLNLLSQQQDQIDILTFYGQLANTTRPNLSPMTITSMDYLTDMDRLVGVLPRPGTSSGLLFTILSNKGQSWRALFSSR